MRFKLLIIPLNILLLTVFGSSYAMAGDATIIQDANPNGVGSGIFFTLVILVLLVLALWLLKNSTLLNKTAGSDEKDGKQWLGNNLKNLDTHQLETLISRSNSQKKNAGNH